MRPRALLLALLAASAALAAAIPAVAAEDAGWTPPGSATVRPGVRVYSNVGQCTSNFVFTSPDGAATYLGLAAHCVGAGGVGKPVSIRGTDGQDVPGTVVYVSWATMDAVGEVDEEIRRHNDFALVRVDDAHRAKVNPAVLHFGGPTDLATRADAPTGTKVLSYGNSGLRPGGALSWKEGYVLGSGKWNTNLYSATPGIFGDSGSGVLTGDGRALCVLVTLIVTPYPAGNGCTNLERALEYARAHAGVDARLATWEVLDPGLLPAVR